VTGTGSSGRGESSHGCCTAARHACEGQRFQASVLEYRLGGLNIAKVRIRRLEVVASF
jgi:excinuclease UvrABC ATPase subunit